MIEIALKPAADIIAGLDWIDAFGGMASPVEVVDEVEGVAIRKRYPARQGLSSDACYRAHRYLDLVPDSRKKAIAYFETMADFREVRRVTNQKRVGEMHMSGSIRLVYWLNLQKLGVGASDSENYAARAALHLVRVLRGRFSLVANGVPFTSLEYDDFSFVRRSPQIFGAYDYGPSVQALMLHPFDYGAIDFTVNAVFRTSCIPDLTTSTPLECISI